MGPGTGGEYVSTGHLPSPRQVQATVEEAYRRYARDDSGEVSRTYPALGRVPGHLFGICVAGVSGGVYRVGDSRHEFTIMSVAKPFVFALVCDALGDEPVRQKLGVNATGLPVTLARGGRDAMNTDGQLARLGVPAVTLPGLGHNAHVESPHVTITLLDPYR